MQKKAVQQAGLLSDWIINLNQKKAVFAGLLNDLKWTSAVSELQSHLTYRRNFW